MAQTSIHFQAVKGGSEEHNKRTKKLDYVHHELSSQNDYWQSDTQEARLAFVTQNAKAKTGRKMQAKATPIPPIAPRMRWKIDMGWAPEEPPRSTPRSIRQQSRLRCETITRDDGDSGKAIPAREVRMPVAPSM